MEHHPSLSTFGFDKSGIKCRTYRVRKIDENGFKVPSHSRDILLVG